MAPPTGSAKPVKKWDDTMVAHLFFSIYNTVDISFTPENKVAIETMMKDKFNHDVNWNGIRTSPPIGAAHISLNFLYLWPFYLSFALYPSYFRPAIMSPPRSQMKWDPKVHEDILVAINDVAKLAREDWEHVIQALHGMGYSFTESALK
ncbi:hypothetical protein F5B21DRAFT_501670 [Xylaria acuta]|nr:hypothetical protein F5B21DRAFT_501670 [Xylaria acuta]